MGAVIGVTRSGNDNLKNFVGESKDVVVAVNPVREYAATRMVASDCAGGQQGVSGTRRSGLERTWPPESDVTFDRPEGAAREGRED